MSGKDTGGPAYPSGMGMHGITLRDYFAAKASEKDVDNALCEASLSGELGGISAASRRAYARFMCADAMLAERAK